jgi:hypothetical protein
MNLELMNKLKDKLNEKSKGQAIFFKPTEGETVIRIVPLKSNKDNPFQELQFHYGFEAGKKPDGSPNELTILSPRSYGEVDPIADFCDSVRKGGNLTKDEFKTLMKKYAPTSRTYVPVIVRGKEDEGVKFWAFGKKIFEQILAICADEDYGDISDVEQGHDIKITFTPQEKSETNFAQTELMVRPKKTLLATDSALRDKWLNDQPVLMDAFKKWTKAELDEALNANLNSEAVQEVTESSTDGWDTTPAPAIEAKPKLSEETKADFSALFD